MHKPLLLLDDIFDRLDDKRIARLLELVADDTFGQVFLTDTNLARTDQRVGWRGEQPILRFRVQNGTVAPFSALAYLCHGRCHLLATPV
ncbi:MAG: hypothetical protein WKG07_24440 [Hymenobacter sp.]